MSAFKEFRINFCHKPFSNKPRNRILKEPYEYENFESCYMRSYPLRTEDV